MEAVMETGTKHVQVALKLNPETDSDILEYLNRSGNRQGTIKKALRMKMESEVAMTIKFEIKSDIRSYEEVNRQRTYYNDDELHRIIDEERNRFKILAREAEDPTLTVTATVEDNGEIIFLQKILSK